MFLGSRLTYHREYDEDPLYFVEVTEPVWRMHLGNLVHGARRLLRFTLLVVLPATIALALFLANMIIAVGVGLAAAVIRLVLLVVAGTGYNGRDYRY
jgi:uncharacterized Tic20 family protein